MSKLFVAKKLEKKGRSRKRFIEIPIRMSNPRNSTHTENCEEKPENRRNFNPFPIGGLSSSSENGDTLPDAHDDDGLYDASLAPLALDSVGRNGSLLVMSTSAEASTRDEVQGVQENDDPLTCTKINNWRVIWALVITNGSRRLTKDGCQSVRSFSDSLSVHWNIHGKLMARTGRVSRRN